MPEKNDELEQLREAFRADPHNRDTASRLAEMYTDLGWLNKSIQIYKDLVEIYSNDFTLLLAYGNVCFTKQNIKEALAVFKKLTVLKPARVEGWNNLGIVLLACEDYESAKNAFEKVLEIEPENHGALLNMGNYYDHVGNPEKAIALFKKATAIKPYFHDAWFNLGNAYVTKKQFHKAIDAYEKTLKYDPKFFSALKNMGYAYEQLEEYEHAEKYYLQALELSKVDASLYINIASIQSKQKQYDAAKDNFLRAVKLAPKEAAGWLGLRDVSLKKGDVKTYVKSTNAILHRLDCDRIAESLQTLRRLSQYASVDAIVKAVDKLDKANDALDAERMLAYERSGKDAATASLLYKRLQGLASPSDHVLQCLAEYCCQKQRYEKAIQYVQAMKNAGSTDLYIQWHALIAGDALDVAEQLIEQYLSDHQDCFEGWYQLARIHVKKKQLKTAGDLLMQALEAGFVDLDRMDDEPRLKALYDSLTQL